MIRLLLTLLLLPGLLSARAVAFELSFPVDCTLGQDCYIQNYVDRDPGPGWRDVGCGHLSYDGHRGTDIALYTEDQIDRDVPVRPVAPGTVHATRDGMPDIRASAEGAPDLSGRSCGNAVVINHTDGWQSTYCHLKRGSVAVRSGDIVDAATPLGVIGLSGRTEFAHLHLTLTQNGETVDPFQTAPELACGVAKDTLWRDEFGYAPAGLIAAGAAPALPSFASVTKGDAHNAVLPRDAAALVFWALFFGPKAGDEIRFEVLAPDGAMFHSQTVLLERDQARAFRASGRRRGSDPWPPGTYSAVITLTRSGTAIDQTFAEVEVQ